MEPPVSMRLLVASRIISFLNGNEGQAISEMKEATGADIQIMRVEEVSCGASDNDMVVKVQLRTLSNSSYYIWQKIFRAYTYYQAQIKPLLVCIKFSVIY